MCTRCCVVETQISLAALASFDADGRAFSGRTYTEDAKHPGAAIDGETSFWLTRASLLNILRDAGFTSVTEVLSPLVPEIAAFEDHVFFVAMRGTATGARSLPEFASLLETRWPERMARRRHPVQQRFGRWPIIGPIVLRRFSRTIREKRSSP